MGPQISQIVREKTVSVDAETPVGDAIKAVREHTPAADGVAVYYLYITDGDELVGVVSMRELLNAEDDAPVSEILTTDPVTVSTSEPLQRAIGRIIEHRFAVLPVVDDENRFVGVVRANDVVDAMDEQTTKQMFKQAGFWFG